MQWFHRGDTAWDGTRAIAMRPDEVRAEEAAATAARLFTPAGVQTFAPPPQRGWTHNYDGALVAPTWHVHAHRYIVQSARPV